MHGLSFIIICSLFLSSCSYHIQKDQGNANDVAYLSENAVVSSSIILRSVLQSCARCHNGGTPPNLGTLDLIKANISTVESEIRLDLMPPTSSGYTALDACKKAMLHSWIQSGMLDQTSILVRSLPECSQMIGNKPAPEENILKMPVNYETLVTKVLQPACLHCHSPNSSDFEASQILLFPFSELIKSRRLVEAPSTSNKFVHLVTRNDDARMPPLNEKKLSDDEIEFIKRWIDAGHPEK